MVPEWMWVQSLGRIVLFYILFVSIVLFCVLFVSIVLFCVLFVSIVFYVLFVSIVLFCVLFLSIVLFYVCVDCIFYVLFVSILLFYVLFVCKCVLYYRHRVSTQLQLNIYHIIYPIVSYILRCRECHARYFVLNVVFTIPECLQYKLKLKDHIKQPSLIGLHVSTPDGSSSGPHSHTDPDIQMFNAMWDPTTH